MPAGNLARYVDHGTLSAVSAVVTPPRSGGALEEVRLRYARGEMDRDEFIQLMRDLGGSARGVEPTEPGAESGST